MRRQRWPVRGGRGHREIAAICGGKDGELTERQSAEDGVGVGVVQHAARRQAAAENVAALGLDATLREGR